MDGVFVQSTVSAKSRSCKIWKFTKDESLRRVFHAGGLEIDGCQTTARAR